MISIKKDFENPPQLLVQSRRDDHIKDALTTKNEHKFNGSIYRDKTKTALEMLYKHKCAYCETDTTAGAPLQVEHFRPKAKTEGDSAHYGYYWLAYEWSNLTLGCSICNRKKGIHFPIFGTRIHEPLLGTDGLPTSEYLSLNSAIFLGEQAILLNPEIDKVEKHFCFLPTGEIKGVDKRGKKTIEILDLNRLQLTFHRRKILDDNLKELAHILEEFGRKLINIDQCRYAVKQVFERIKLLQNPDKQYSRFGYFLYHEFDIFFANQLLPKQRDALLKFFDLFKNNVL
jgi:uncharacterized protein (TIGR02646 family)